LVLIAAYFVSYGVFRAANQEVWTQDNKTYVIFPSGTGKALYYFWRPLMLVDAKLTDMNFHIGPHQ
jgi:hypothetical protein